MRDLEYILLKFQMSFFFLRSLTFDSRFTIVIAPQQSLSNVASPFEES